MKIQKEALKAAKKLVAAYNKIKLRELILYHETLKERPYRYIRTVTGSFGRSCKLCETAKNLSPNLLRCICFEGRCIWNVYKDKIDSERISFCQEDGNYSKIIWSDDPQEVFKLLKQRIQTLKGLIKIAEENQK